MDLGTDEGKSAELIKVLKEKVVRKDKVILLLRELLQVKEKATSETALQNLFTLRSKSQEAATNLQKQIFLSFNSTKQIVEQQDIQRKTIEELNLSLDNSQGTVAHLEFQLKQLVEVKHQQEKTIRALRESLKTSDKQNGACNCVSKPRKKKLKDKSLGDPPPTPAYSVSSCAESSKASPQPNLLTDGLLTPESSSLQSSPGTRWLDLDSRSNSPSASLPDLFDVTVPPLLTPIQSATRKPLHDDLSMSLPSHFDNSIQLSAVPISECTFEMKASDLENQLKSESCSSNSISQNPNMFCSSPSELANPNQLLKMDRFGFDLKAKPTPGGSIFDLPNEFSKIADEYVSTSRKDDFKPEPHCEQMVAHKSAESMLRDDLDLSDNLSDNSDLDMELNCPSPDFDIKLEKTSKLDDQARLPTDEIPPRNGLGNADGGDLINSCLPDFSDVSRVADVPKVTKSDTNSPKSGINASNSSLDEPKVGSIEMLSMDNLNSTTGEPNEGVEVPASKSLQDNVLSNACIINDSTQGDVECTVQSTDQHALKIESEVLDEFMNIVNDGFPSDDTTPVWVQEISVSPNNVIPHSSPKTGSRTPVQAHVQEISVSQNDVLTHSSPKGRSRSSESKIQLKQKSFATSKVNRVVECGNNLSSHSPETKDAKDSNKRARQTRSMATAQKLTEMRITRQKKKELTSTIHLKPNEPARRTRRNSKLKADLVLPEPRRSRRNSSTSMKSEMNEQRKETPKKIPEPQKDSIECETRSFDHDAKQTSDSVRMSPGTSESHSPSVSSENDSLSSTSPSTGRKKALRGKVRRKICSPAKYNNTLPKSKVSNNSFCHQSNQSVESASTDSFCLDSSCGDTARAGMSQNPSQNEIDLSIETDSYQASSKRADTHSVYSKVNRFSNPKSAESDMSCMNSPSYGKSDDKKGSVETMNPAENILLDPVEVYSKTDQARISCDPSEACVRGTNVAELSHSQISESAYSKNLFNPELNNVSNTLDPSVSPLRTGNNILCSASTAIHSTSSPFSRSFNSSSVTFGGQNLLSFSDLKSRSSSESNQYWQSSDNFNPKAARNLIRRQKEEAYGYSRPEDNVDNLRIGQLCLSLNLLSMDPPLTNRNENYFTKFKKEDVSVGDEYPPTFLPLPTSRVITENQSSLKFSDCSKFYRYRDSADDLNETFDTSSKITIEIKQEDAPFSFKVSVPAGNPLEPVIGSLRGMFVDVPSKSISLNVNRRVGKSSRPGSGCSIPFVDDYSGNIHDPPPARTLFQKTHLSSCPPLLGSSIRSQANDRFVSSNHQFKFENKTVPSCRWGNEVIKQPNFSPVSSPHLRDNSSSESKNTTSLSESLALYQSKVELKASRLGNEVPRVLENSTKGVSHLVSDIPRQPHQNIVSPEPLPTHGPQHTVGACAQTLSGGLSGFGSSNDYKNPSESNLESVSVDPYAKRKRSGATISPPTSVCQISSIGGPLQCEKSAKQSDTHEGSKGLDNQEYQDPLLINSSRDHSPSGKSDSGTSGTHICSQQIDSFRQPQANVSVAPNEVSSKNSCPLISFVLPNESSLPTPLLSNLDTSSDENCDSSHEVVAKKSRLENSPRKEVTKSGNLSTFPLTDLQKAEVSRRQSLRNQSAISSPKGREVVMNPLSTSSMLRSSTISPDPKRNRASTKSKKKLAAVARRTSPRKVSAVRSFTANSIDKTLEPASEKNNITDNLKDVDENRVKCSQCHLSESCCSCEIERIMAEMVYFCPAPLSPIPDSPEPESPPLMSNKIPLSRGEKEVCEPPSGPLDDATSDTNVCSKRKTRTNEVKIGRRKKGRKKDDVITTDDFSHNDCDVEDQTVQTRSEKVTIRGCENLDNGSKVGKSNQVFFESSASSPKDESQIDLKNTVTAECDNDVLSNSLDGNILKRKLRRSSGRLELACMQNNKPVISKRISRKSQAEQPRTLCSSDRMPEASSSMEIGEMAEKDDLISNDTPEEHLSMQSGCIEPHSPTPKKGVVESKQPRKGCSNDKMPEASSSVEIGEMAEKDDLISNDTPEGHLSLESGCIESHSPSPKKVVESMQPRKGCSNDKMPEASSSVEIGEMAEKNDSMYNDTPEEHLSMQSDCIEPHSPTPKKVVESMQPRKGCSNDKMPEASSSVEIGEMAEKNDSMYNDTPEEHLSMQSDCIEPHSPTPKKVVESMQPRKGCSNDKMPEASSSVEIDEMAEQDDLISKDSPEGHLNVQSSCIEPQKLSPTPKKGVNELNLISEVGTLRESPGEVERVSSKLTDSVNSLDGGTDEVKLSSHSQETSSVECNPATKQTAIDVLLEGISTFPESQLTQCSVEQSDLQSKPQHTESRKTLDLLPHLEKYFGRNRSIESKISSVPSPETNEMSEKLPLRSDDDSESEMVIDYFSSSDSECNERIQSTQETFSTMTEENQEPSLIVPAENSEISSTESYSQLDSVNHLRNFYTDVHHGNAGDEKDELPLEETSKSADPPQDVERTLQTQLPTFYSSLNEDSQKEPEAKKLIAIATGSKVCCRLISAEDVIPCSINMLAFASFYNLEETKSPFKGLEPYKKYQERIENSLNEFFHHGDLQNSLKKAVSTLHQMKPYHIGRAICKVVGESNHKTVAYERSGITPNFTITQKKAVLLVSALAKGRFQYFKDLLDQIEEYLIPSPKSDIPLMSYEVINVAAVYALICRTQGLFTRVQSFIYDLLYGRHITAFRIIYQILLVIPQAIPWARDSIGPVTFTIVYLIMKQGIYQNLNPLYLTQCAVIPLRQRLSTKYGYSFPPDVTRDTVIEELMSNIMVKGCDKAIILISKSQGYKWTFSVVQKYIFPVIGKWMEGEETDEDLVSHIIRLLGLVSRCFAISVCDTFVSSSLKILKGVIKNNPSLPVAEAVVETLVHFKRLNSEEVIRILANWTPHDYTITKSCVRTLQKITDNKPYSHFRQFMM